MSLPTLLNRLLLLLFLSPNLLLAAETPNFIAFESAPVRPIAQFGSTLVSTNIPDNRLEIFHIEPGGKLLPQGSVMVGMEPVAVALRNTDNGLEAWVVNHLSDSITIVDLSQPPYRVKRTLLTGDEPRDIVFAQGKAFITTAHRGQHRAHSSIKDVPGAGDPQLFTAGVPRADIWVFPLEAKDKTLGGKPLKIIELFGDTPRALAVSPDQSTVYAAIFNSGNQTTAITESALCNGFDDYGFAEGYLGTSPCQMMDKITSPNGLADGMLPGGRPGPGKNKAGEYQPWTGMIVKYDNQSGEWRDVKGRNFSNAVRFTLPDYDVFAIDTRSLNTNKQFSHVGTTLFNMAVNPKNGLLYVTNTDAQNHIRFEGRGDFAGSTLQGNIARARISLIDPKSNQVQARHLNSHINYKQLKAEKGVKQHSIAQPTQIQISADGKYAYVASASSGKVAIYSTDVLENDLLWPMGKLSIPALEISRQHIDISDGPMGILLHKNQKTLYVLSRYNNSIKVVDLLTKAVVQQQQMYNPEPEKITRGRFMLYDAKRSSSNGEVSCASCHIAGDMDQLAWNLGDPDKANTRNPQPFPTLNLTQLACKFGGLLSQDCRISKLLNGNGDPQTFASMKGPMTTQTMRGMSTHGHMHWRGDRANGYFGTDTKHTLDERLSFKNFIVAFDGLHGLDIDLPASVKSQKKSPRVKQLERDMELFADFMLSVQLPPNPIRNLDNSFNANAAIGQAFFHGQRKAVGLPEKKHRPSWFPDTGPDTDGFNCNRCHELNPAKGFYGANGEATHGGELQVFKTPQLRNLYQKVGMFGMPYHFGYRPTLTNKHQGQQIRGFGFLHDGATDLLFNFLGGRVFDNGDISCEQEGLDEEHGCDFNFKHVGIPNDRVRQGLVEYLMAFDSDLAPIVGQQITINQTYDTAHIRARIRLLQQRANTNFVSKVLGGDVKECDLIAHGSIDNQVRGYLYRPATQDFAPDSPLEANQPLFQLIDKAIQGNNSLTFTCAPPGSGKRMALDRNLDNVLNNQS